MRRAGSFVLVVAAVALLSSVVWGQEKEQGKKEQPRVSLAVQNQPAGMVAAAIQKQSGVQVAVLPGVQATVSLKLDAVPVEEAVKSLTEAFDGSWIRGYLIEVAPPDPPYKADELLAGMAGYRDAWMQSLTDEQRQELFSRWRQAWRQQAQDRQGQGAGAQAGQGQPGNPGGRRGRQPTDDPLRRIRLPLYEEKVTLKLEDKSLLGIVHALTFKTGYFVLLQEGLQDKKATAEFEKVPVGEAVELLAKAVGAKSRPFYLIAEPRVLSQQELEQRRQERFTRMWGEFWKLSPEERAQRIQRIVDRINQIPPDSTRFQRFGPRMLSRLTQYSATLDPARRKELKPLLQALGAKLQH